METVDLRDAPGLRVRRGGPSSWPGLRGPRCVFLTTSCDSALEAAESGPQDVEETGSRTLLDRVKHQELLG